MPPPLAESGPAVLLLLAKSAHAMPVPLQGVQYVFGVPGEENLDFVESLRKSSIKLIVTRHEQTGHTLYAVAAANSDFAPYRHAWHLQLK